jgi:hypothetical protein
VETDPITCLPVPLIGVANVSNLMPFEANADGTGLSNAQTYHVPPGDDLIRCHQGLVTVADQCIVQTILKRAELGFVVPPLDKPIAENRLANLL